MLCGADRKPRTKEAAPGGASEMANSLMDFTIIYECLQGLPWLSVIEKSPGYIPGEIYNSLVLGFLSAPESFQYG